MGIKDRMLWWLVKNIIMPRNEVIDKPGFIVLRISEKRGVVNLREVLLPENLFSELEKQIINKYGKKGKHILYSAGKKFGYRFALISQYPRADKEKDFLKFSYFLVRYLESIYARRVEHSIDFRKNMFVFRAKNWIVCNKNCLVHLLFVWTGAGMLSYAFSDVGIEGVQVKCEGRGDDHCELICAPKDYFRGRKIEFESEEDLENLGIDILKYNGINSIRKARYTSNSFKSLIDGGFLKYREGTIKMEDERFLLIESSVMYLLERELKKLEDGLDILWNVSFRWGENFSKNIKKQDPSKFISDFFPALGFGDILVKKDPWKVLINYFPWTKWADEIDFAMFRGMLSGIISGLTGKKIELKNARKKLTLDGFSLVLE